MKKLLIAATATSLLASGVAVSDMASGPKLYGAVNAGVSLVNSTKTIDKATNKSDDNKAASGMTVNNHSSKFGIKGSNDLGDGLSAVYKLEFGADADTNKVIARKASFVGLKGGFGTVKFGRFGNATTAFKATDTHATVGTDNVGRTTTLTISGVEMTVGGKFNIFDNTTSNAIGYTSPSFSGVKLGLTLSPDEGNAKADGTTAATAANSSIADNIAFAVAYGSKSEGIYAALGYQKDGNSSTTESGSPVDSVKVNAETQTYLAVQYADSGLIVNLTSATKNSGVEGTTAQTLISLNASYAVGDITPALTYGSIKHYADLKSSLVGLSATYKLGKGTKAFAAYVIDTVDFDGEVDSNTSLKVGLKASF